MPRTFPPMSWASFGENLMRCYFAHVDGRQTLRASLCGSRSFHIFFFIDFLWNNSTAISLNNEKKTTHNFCFVRHCRRWLPPMAWTIWLLLIKSKCVTPTDSTSAKIVILVRTTSAALRVHCQCLMFSFQYPAIVRKLFFFRSNTFTCFARHRHSGSFLVQM